MGEWMAYHVAMVVNFPGTDCPVPDVGNHHLVWND